MLWAGGKGEPRRPGGRSAAGVHSAGTWRVSLGSSAAVTGLQEQQAPSVPEGSIDNLPTLEQAEFTSDAEPWN